MRESTESIEDSSPSSSSSVRDLVDAIDACRQECCQDEAENAVKDEKARGKSGVAQLQRRRETPTGGIEKGPLGPEANTTSLDFFSSRSALSDSDSSGSHPIPASVCRNIAQWAQPCIVLSSSHRASTARSSLSAAISWYRFDPTPSPKNVLLSGSTHAEREPQYASARATRLSTFCSSIHPYLSREVGMLWCAALALCAYSVLRSLAEFVKTRPSQTLYRFLEDTAQRSEDYFSFRQAYFEPISASWSFAVPWFLLVLVIPTYILPPLINIDSAVDNWEQRFKTAPCFSWQVQNIWQFFAAPYRLMRETVIFYEYHFGPGAKYFWHWAQFDTTLETSLQLIRFLEMCGLKLDILSDKGVYEIPAEDAALYLIQLGIIIFQIISSLLCLLHRRVGASVGMALLCNAGYLMLHITVSSGKGVYASSNPLNLISFLRSQTWLDFVSSWVPVYAAGYELSVLQLFLFAHAREARAAEVVNRWVPAENLSSPATGGCCLSCPSPRAQAHQSAHQSPIGLPRCFAGTREEDCCDMSSSRTSRESFCLPGVLWTEPESSRNQPQAVPTQMPRKGIQSSATSFATIDYSASLTRRKSAGEGEVDNRSRRELQGRPLPRGLSEPRGTRLSGASFLPSLRAVEGVVKKNLSKGAERFCRTATSEWSASQRLGLARLLKMQRRTRAPFILTLWTVLLLNLSLVVFAFTIIRLIKASTGLCEAALPAWDRCTHKTYPVFGSLYHDLPCNCRVFLEMVHSDSYSAEELEKDWEKVSMSLPFFSTLEVLSRTFLGSIENRQPHHPPLSTRHQALRIFIFEFSSMTELPSVLSELPLLERISCNYNQVTSLDPKLAGLRNLATLVVRHTHIKEVPFAIARLPSLTRLALDPSPFCTSFVRDPAFRQSLPPDVVARLERLESCTVHNVSSAGTHCLPSCKDGHAFFPAVDLDGDLWITFSEALNIVDTLPIENFKTLLLLHNGPKWQDAKAATWWTFQAYFNIEVTNCAECEFAPDPNTYPAPPDLSDWI